MLRDQAPPWAALYPSQVPPSFEARSETALDAFALGVEERPDAPAIHFFDATLSFAEADAQANALAAALRELGVVPGDRVALYLQNDPQFVIGLHGCWLAGAIAVALNPMLAARELEYQLVDAEVSVVICLESLLPTVAAVRRHTRVDSVVVCSPHDYLERAVASLGERPEPVSGDLPRLAELLRRHEGERVPSAEVEAGDVALLCYTSGTTGPPKAAMLTHRNLVHAEAYQHAMAVGEDDVIVGGAPLFHVTGITGHIMLSRICRSPLVLFHRFEASEYLRMVERWRGTHSILALTAYIAILDHPDIGRRDISSLDRVFTGGAPVSPAVVERFEAVTGQYMHNTYGMTETSSATHIVPYGMRAPIDPATGALAVGLPAPNVDARIVDLEDGSELPPGELGEIKSMGPTVVPGYWNNPRQTAHALRDGFMHTGDVGVRDGDGWFYLVDRAKDLIVAGGYKVWPREVEDVIYEHPAVREVAVVGVADDYRGETVKAFVSPRPGATVTPEEIIEHCRAVMAAYKYPRQVEIVDQLPKTVTGKLARRRLREKEKADFRPRAEELPPIDQRVVFNEEDGLYAK